MPSHPQPAYTRSQDVAVQENFAKAESYIRSAAAQGAVLAVLPEYHLTSWCPDHPDFVSACASSMGYLERYQDLARELNINIVPGTICEVHPAASGSSSDDSSEKAMEIRNMVYWITATTGATAAAYQKKNLWHPERPHLAAGAVHSPHAAFDTPLTWPADNQTRQGGRPIRGGMLICWDAAFPEAFRALVADGAELIVVPSFWVVDGSDLDEARRAMNPRCEALFLEGLMVARAFENDCVVVFCNTGGLSQVAVPVLGAAGGVGEVNAEEMRVVDVDFEAVRALERAYKVREDMRGAGWQYGSAIPFG